MMTIRGGIARQKCQSFFFFLSDVWYYDIYEVSLNI